VTGADSSDIKEIVVTAQKRSERLVDVPISISVVSPGRNQDSRRHGRHQKKMPIPFTAQPFSAAFVVQDHRCPLSWMGR
jgi:hypothetical protein